MADERMQVNEPDVNQLRKVRREKLKGLQAEGKDPFRITVYDQEHHTEQVKAMFLAEEAKEQPEALQVSLAGRLMQKRVMGKASFCNLQDRDGNIQVYATRDMLGEEPYAAFKKLDVGDIVGVKGEMFRTEKGEITVRAKEITLLSKCLQILPEKYHGLTNTDIRYRQRYVDLIMNPEVKDTFIKRSKIISAIRRYLDERGFMEVETPMLVENAGGAAARPFVTHFNALDEDKKLRISLELYLKRLIVGGLERVYEIGRVFRNEGLDIKHNPEFTLMELYQAYTDYEGMMRLTEDMYRTVAEEVLGTTVLEYKGQTIDIGKPWKRMTMTEAVKKYSGVDFDQITTLEEARAAAAEKNVEIQPRHSIGEIMNEFFDAYVEDNLIQPTFITNHPIEISPLTKKDPENPGKVLRFEMFMNGWEMCNAYSELNDPIDQRERFKAQEAQLAAGNDEANTTDEDFLNALEIGMPPTGGIGYGIDRMVMLFTGAEAIRDVLLFPTMKTLGKQDAQKAEKEKSAEGLTADLECACNTCPSQEACKAAQEAEKAAPAEEKIDFTGVEIEPLFKDYVDFETFSKSDFRVVKVLACEAVPKSKKLLKFTLDDGTGTDRTILSGIHAFYEPEELVGKTLVAITNLPPRPMMGLESCGMLLSALHKVNGEERLNLLMVDPHMPAGAKLY
ncbi:MAG: lysine--tRNA ligase [Lachnospiraceae bacterium]|nr:lysine--tRNA ligase [Lachnospiraceae bacterium]